jgi:PAS domain S-box-containing protein
MQLVLLGFVLPLSRSDPFWQANLLAQCGTALLVAAAADWIRFSEARYRQVVTRIPVVLYSARVKQPAAGGRAPPLAELTFISPAARALFGAEPEELVGDYGRWLARVHPEDQEVLVGALSQLGRQRLPVTCEYRLAPDYATGARSADHSTAFFAPRSALAALRSALSGPYGSTVITVRHGPSRPRVVRDTLAPLFGPTGELEGWDGVVSDITEQRALADDLRRTTSMFHALVANLPAGVFFIQGDPGQPILVNARARQLLGQREDPAAGLNRLVQTYRLCRPDGSPYPTDELPVVSALRRGVTGMRDDIVVHRPDGTQLPLITWGAPIDLGGQGVPDAAVWVFEDLTALQQAEAARRESEARLRTVIETMAEGLVVLDEQGVIVECNPAACSILGVPADALRGRSSLDPGWGALNEDGEPLPPNRHPAMQSLRTGRPVRDVVMGVPRPDGGGVRWLLVNTMPLPGHPFDPGSGRVVTTFADITAYRQALVVLRASEEKYRVLVETLPLMLVQLDREGRVTYMNPAAQAVSGYGPEDLTAGGSWEALACAEDRPKAEEAFRQALAGKTARVEVRFRAKDGSEKVGYVLTEPRRQGGAVLGTTALIVDMTRERQLELELQRSQRLELIGRLSSGIAHDFNNLLTVVLALAELAQNNLPPDHPTQNDLRRIAYAGEQAANLAHQLLAFSKNRQAMPRRIDVNRVARRTLELLRATLPKSIRIEAELADEDLSVLADEMQLQQVLMNLCLNARDAMPAGGRLAVRTQREAAPGGNGRTDGLGGDGWVRLTVEDTGEGIPEDMRSRIFDAFFSTKERGTGLGLAMVRQIVEGFGGRVEVFSRVGEGSRFDVWLPASGEAAPLAVVGHG